MGGIEGCRLIVDRIGEYRVCTDRCCRHGPDGVEKAALRRGRSPRNRCDGRASRSGRRARPDSVGALPPALSAPTRAAHCSMTGYGSPRGDPSPARGRRSRSRSAASHPARRLSGNSRRSGRCRRRSRIGRGPSTRALSRSGPSPRLDESGVASRGARAAGHWALADRSGPRRSASGPRAPAA